MEDTPLVNENDPDDTELRSHKDNPEKRETYKTRAKQPEALGILAVEPKPERLPAEKLDLAEGQHSPEHIGHMLLTSKAETDKQDRQLPPETTSSSTGKRIDTLSRAELMTLSEKIIIDGSSLRQIYETHLIGERGLRRLVAENIRGGDLRKALRQEVLERERDFERDPAMRDLALPAEAPADSSNATLEKLLQKAAVGVADSGEEAAFFKARARYEAVHHQRHHQQQRRLIDISLFIVITTLVVLVIIMYLARR